METVIAHFGTPSYQALTRLKSYDKAELSQIDLDQRHDEGIWLRKISAPASLPKGAGKRQWSRMPRPPTPCWGVAPQQTEVRAMTEQATAKFHHRLFYALAAAAGLGLGLALIAFCDAWFSGSGFNGVQFIGAR